MVIDEIIEIETEMSQPCDEPCKDAYDCESCRSHHKHLVECLKELKKYREIGTVDECRAAVEKQTAAKPLGGMDIEGNEYAICRECSSILSDGEWFAQYCPDCGKKVDWRDEE